MNETATEPKPLTECGRLRARRLNLVQQRRRIDEAIAVIDAKLTTAAARERSKELEARRAAPVPAVS